jgi:methyl-accepting chemotaxis protein
MDFNLGQLLEKDNLDKLKKTINQALSDKGSEKNVSKETIIKAEEVNKIIDHITEKLKEMDAVSKNLATIEKDLNEFTSQTHETKEDIVNAMKVISQASKDIQSCIQTIRDIKEGIDFAMTMLSGLLMFLPIPGLHLLTGN